MSDNKNESERLLSELESLNNTLENEQFDLDSEQQLDDLPVLKSFVEDVPILSDRILKEEPETILAAPKSTQEREQEPTIENDPLAISDFVKQKRAAGLTANNYSQQPKDAIPPVEAAPITPTRPAIVAKTTNTPPPEPAATGAKLENNPFLPQSAKDRIRDHKNDASSELHQLLRQSAKASFDDGHGSPEYQRPRSKASTAIDQIVKTHLPRLEAELRMRLEAEVDTMLREQNKD